MPNFNSLKKDISLINDIVKITNAMKLVSFAKLKVIGKKIVETQNYVSEVYEVFNTIIKNTDKSIFLKNEPVQFNKTLWVVINSNIGLCGGYNINVNKLVLNSIQPQDEVYAIGLKAVNFYKARKITINKSILSASVNFSSQEAKEIGNDLLEYFLKQDFDQIKLVYTTFVNNITFKATELRLFPIVKTTDKLVKKDNYNYTLEPSAQEVLESTLNLYLSSVIYGAVIESQVSEYASRRIAMENATKNGEDLRRAKQIEFNRKRQSAITQEINEIISGANAGKK